MVKNILITIFVVVFTSKLIFGQMTFQKAIGGPQYEFCESIIQTIDSGYAFIGSTSSFGSGNNDFYIVKLDLFGNIQWTKTIGGPEWEYGQSLIQTFDGGYAFTGTSNSFGAGSWDACVVKLDNSGNIQWSKTIGGTLEEAGQGIVQTNDGGFVVCGNTSSYGAGINDLYIVKLDNSGNLLWTKTIGGSLYQIGNAIINTSDGGTAIVGETRNFGAGGYDIYLIKLDGTGNVQWKKTYGGYDDDYGYAITQTNDNGYCIAGTTNSFVIAPTEVYIVKLDSLGIIQWTKTIGGGNGDGGQSVIQSSDGGIVICGSTRSFGAGETDIYLIKLDINGNLLWTKAIGGSLFDYASSIKQTYDGGFIIGGETRSYGSGSMDAFILKLDNNAGQCGTFNVGGNVLSGGSSFSGGSISSGGISNSFNPQISSGGNQTNVCSSVSILEHEDQDLYSIFPNPASETFTVYVPKNISTSMQFELVDLYGNLIQSKHSIFTGNNVFRSDSYKSGIYFIKIIEEDGQTIFKKLIIKQ